MGWAPQDVPGTVRAAESLLAEGPRVVALATGEGDVVAWPGGHVLLPHLGEDPVDPTGAGDAFVAALTVALLRGQSPESAAWWAAAAAAEVVGSAGGRPDLYLGPAAGVGLPGPPVGRTGAGGAVPGNERRPVVRVPAVHRPRIVGLTGFEPATP
ncbi:UNVERIFIED_CONTAM: PfkB family carbohydrate kinase [Kocuria sp. CPCC 205274]